MATQVICDRCKRVIIGNKSYARSYEIYRNGIELDLCRSCYLDIMRIIESPPTFLQIKDESNEQEKEN